MMPNKRIKLETIAINEKNDDGTFNYYLAPFHVNDFNLLIGDNAQGKTRFFNSLMFLRLLFLGVQRQINTSYKAEFNFIVKDSDAKTENKISYVLEILKNENGSNKYIEQVSKDGTDLFSTSKGLLIDEKENTEIKNVFYPPNNPAVFSIVGENFETIGLIRNFFQRICLIESSKPRGMAPEFGATIPDTQGLNIAEVLSTWEKNDKDAFEEVIYYFKNYFPFVDTVEVKETPAPPMPGLPMGMMAHILNLKEKSISVDIPQVSWSDGMLRTLTLLCLPKGYLNVDGKKVNPSLVCIDEIENGLDFKTLKYVIEYFIDCSEDAQVFISSHSPLICGFVHPKHWRIVKRNGPIIRMFSPNETEKNLDEQLELFKHSYWDFYIKHISSSKLYSVPPDEK